ncbi:single-stranded DNA-binding protein [Alloscardovia theropitheci]|uniref:Single-stranded DNA-binding protein n=1 Tax=Alloscardovia theropitheci TaxID=2496842 RepID=A0A4R0QRK8_9BIFI|nr:single-stranded DNA-binding protein [Alloscardovia theropitheci]TCD54993.1 single-stranded DNA-binding protein [Alloscardovia theropitheci]
MTNTAHIVLSGYVGTEPRQWNTTSHIPACSFRVGSTKRYFSAKENQWKSSDTTWVQVKAFRSLATNAIKSLKIGDPIIVTGTLTVDTWEKEGVTHTLPSIEASGIGHDLTLGSTVFSKNEPTAQSRNNEHSNTGSNSNAENDNASHDASIEQSVHNNENNTESVAESTNSTSQVPSVGERTDSLESDGINEPVM